MCLCLLRSQIQTHCCSGCAVGNCNARHTALAHHSTKLSHHLMQNWQLPLRQLCLPGPGLVTKANLYSTTHPNCITSLSQHPGLWIMWQREAATPNMHTGKAGMCRSNSSGTPSMSTTGTTLWSIVAPCGAGRLCDTCRPHVQAAASCPHHCQHQAAGCCCLLHPAPGSLTQLPPRSAAQDTRIHRTRGCQADRYGSGSGEVQTSRTSMLAQRGQSRSPVCEGPTYAKPMDRTAGKIGGYSTTPWPCQYKS
jgi:hypothetical protein